MGINKNTVLDIVHKTLSPRQIEASFVYWDSRIIHAGQSIRMGPLSITMPFEGMMIFVDLGPRVNWAHPCLYLLVGIEDLHTEVVKASFPPYMGDYPETFTIVLRNGKEPPDGRYFKIFDEEPEGGM
jgi:hypothetical protein